MTTYAAGTPIHQITMFDRTTKVAVKCADHPDAGVWHTKDPFVSSWFGPTDPCACKLDRYVTAAEYTS